MQSARQRSIMTHKPGSFSAVNRRPKLTPVLPHLTMLPRAAPPRADVAAI